MSPGTPDQAQQTTESPKEIEPVSQHFDERMQLGIKDMPSYRGELKPLAMPDAKRQ